METVVITHRFLQRCSVWSARAGKGRGPGRDHDPGEFERVGLHVLTRQQLTRSTVGGQADHKSSADEKSSGHSGRTSCPLDKRTGSAVAGAAKQPVQEFRVAVRDIDHLQAALRARHEHHITAAHAESSRHRCQRCLGGLAVNRTLSHPDDQRAIMPAAHTGTRRTRPHPDHDPHKLTVAPRPGGWFVPMIVVAGASPIFGKIEMGGLGSGPAGSAVHLNDTTVTGPALTRLRPGTAARPGTVTLCASHPTAGQRALAAMNWAPALALYLAVILLLAQLLRGARTAGPFAVTVARRLRFLGWLVLAGSVIVTAGQSLARAPSCRPSSPARYRQRATRPRPALPSSWCPCCWPAGC
jgi:hypothetical protein